MDAGSAGAAAAAAEGAKKADPTAGLTGFDLEGDAFEIAEPEPEPVAELEVIPDEEAE
jgi:hypothetical protein